MSAGWIVLVAVFVLAALAVGFGLGYASAVNDRRGGYIR